MRILPPISLSLLAAAALLACGVSACSASGKGGGTTGTSTGGGPATGGGATTTSTTTSASGTGGDDGGLVLNIDAGNGDGASACQHLNIGILGNPGADASANFQTWLTMAGTSVQRIQTATGTPLTAADLQPFDVVILDWLTRDYTPAETATFAAFVAAGGGVVSMTGYDNNTTDDWHANSLLAPLEVAYSGPLLSGPVTTFATHPITAGLTSVTFNGGYAISDLGGTNSTRTPIAFLSPGGGQVTAGYAIQMGSGHAFVWGDEWIEFDSEWSTIPQIKQLWVQVFAWISPANKCALDPPQ
jgi:hypothetical protein